MRTNTNNMHTVTKRLLLLVLNIDMGQIVGLRFKNENYDYQNLVSAIKITEIPKAAPETNKFQERALTKNTR